MKLLLTSDGLSSNRLIQELGDMAGRQFGQMRCVFVPTAANVERGDKWWLVDDIQKSFRLGWGEFEMLDISWERWIWEKKMQESDVVIVGGGNTSYLMHWVVKTEVGEIWKDKIYVGVSAGSAITSVDLAKQAGARLYEESGEFYDGEAGLGWVKFVPWLHVGSKYFPSLTFENIEKEAKKMGLSMYAISDGMGIRVDGSGVGVVGEGEYRVY
jgi:dipeptidase E